jgi:hypothetical protein
MAATNCQVFSVDDNVKFGGKTTPDDSNFLFICMAAEKGDNKYAI